MGAGSVFVFTGRIMRIQRIINNNVISALDERGKEIVAMGKGVGFQRKPGQEIPETGIEKIFRLESPAVLENFKQLVADMPLSCVEVSDEIITYAKNMLSLQLSQSVYLTLTDHIHFALVRFEKGMLFENALYSEIKRFYPEEFAVGRHALELIERKTGVRLPEDEAASIAFHLVNAEYGLKFGDVHVMSEMIRRLMGMVHESYPLQEDSIETDRFMTNLKFILIHLMQGKPGKAEKDDGFLGFVRNYCVKEYELAQKMKEYIEMASGRKMNESEMIYLTIQLKYTI